MKRILKSVVLSLMAVMVLASVVSCGNNPSPEQQRRSDFYEDKN